MQEAELELQKYIDDCEKQIKEIESFLRKKTYTNDELESFGKRIDYWRSVAETMLPINPIETTEVKELTEKIQKAVVASNENELPQIEDTLKLNTEFKEILKEFEINKKKDEKKDNFMKEFNELRQKLLAELSKIEEANKNAEDTVSKKGKNSKIPAYLEFVAPSYHAFVEKLKDIIKLFAKYGVNGSFIDKFLNDAKVNQYTNKTLFAEAHNGKLAQTYTVRYKDDNEVAADYCLSYKNGSNQDITDTNGDGVFNDVSGEHITIDIFEKSVQNLFAVATVANDTAKYINTADKIKKLKESYKYDPDNTMYILTNPRDSATSYGMISSLMNKVFSKIPPFLEDEAKKILKKIDEEHIQLGGGFTELKEMTVNALWKAILRLNAEHYLKSIKALQNKYKSNLVALASSVVSKENEKDKITTPSEINKPLQNYLQYQMRTVNKYDEEIAKLGSMIGLKPNVILGIHFATHKKDIVELLDKYAPLHKNYIFQMLSLKKLSAQYAYQINWNLGSSEKTKTLMGNLITF